MIDWIMFFIWVILVMMMISSSVKSLFILMRRIWFSKIRKTRLWPVSRSMQEDCWIFTIWALIQAQPVSIDFWTHVSWVRIRNPFDFQNSNLKWFEIKLKCPFMELSQPLQNYDWDLLGNAGDSNIIKDWSASYLSITY